MPKTLYAKLSLVLVLILLPLGIVVLLAARFATDNYYQEITQRLNGPIAMYVTEEHPLIENGVVNETAMEQLAHQAMVINPTVEVYLLDANGNVLTHALPDADIQVNRVDMKPIQAFLSGQAELPLRNDDPRNADAQRIFSVSPVGDPQQPEGYVYAILGGEKYQTIAESLEQSYVLKLTLAVIFAAVLFALTTGLITFYVLTRRLRRLENRVTFFRRETLKESHDETSITRSENEIASLEQSFDAMAKRIIIQIENLKQTDAARRDLISNVSHDLRTPLASMQGYIETLLIKEERLDQGQRRQYLEIARKHAVRLSRLVSELFELSKLDNLSLVPTTEPFSITELLYDSVQEFQLSAKQKNVELVLENATDNIMVHADISLIQRVLENLIENALRYTPSNGVVKISLSPKSEHVNITVSDNGCGIEKEKVSRIFERFYRVEEGDRSKTGSAGLGLAIVKRILELHNSSISVDSQVNVGTSFTFDLPKILKAA